MLTKEDKAECETRRSASDASESVITAANDARESAVKDRNCTEAAIEKAQDDDNHDDDEGVWGWLAVFGG